MRQISAQIQEVINNGSTEEKGFSFKKDEETLQRLEARGSHQPC